jgi:hypothetical protein
MDPRRDSVVRPEAGKGVLMNRSGWQLQAWRAVFLHGPLIVIPHVSINMLGTELPLSSRGRMTLGVGEIF